MKKLLLVLLVALPAFGQLIPITGTFKYPDGTPLTGRVTIQLTRSTVTNTCVTPAQVVTFRPVTVVITNGTLAAVSLYPNTCLTLNGQPNLSWPVAKCTNANPMVAFVGQPQITFKIRDYVLLNNVGGNTNCNGVHLATAISSQLPSPANPGQTVTLDNLGNADYTSGGTMFYMQALYVYQVYDQLNRMVYGGKWLVDGSLTTVDVTQMGQN